MKKAIALGIMAFFAINLITVQNVNAQDKKNIKPKKTELQVEKQNEKGEATELQKNEQAPKTNLKECEKKGCEQKGKAGCCEQGKEVKKNNSTDNNLKMKPKEIKVEKETSGKPENTTDDRK